MGFNHGCGRGRDSKTMGKGSVVGEKVWWGDVGKRKKRGTRP